MDNAKILIVYTGGTIGMVETPQGLQPFDFSHLMDNVPKLSELGYTIDSVQFKTPIDSSNMNPGFWNMIVKDIADNYEKYDGFVILHGTDTMAYTASALAFMLRNLRKPVVVTGSQLPIGRGCKGRRHSESCIGNTGRRFQRSKWRACYQ